MPSPLTRPVLHWVLMPVAGLAVIATVVHTMRRRARTPAVRPMSDEWLREFGALRTGD